MVDSENRDWTETARKSLISDEKFTVIMDHIRPEIRLLAERGNITYAEYSELRTNSWEAELLHKSMTNDCLCLFLEEVMLPNCRPKYRNGPCSTYDESVVFNFVPLLIERLRKADGIVLITKDLNSEVP